MSDQVRGPGAKTMLRTILAVVGVILAAVAVWLLVEMRQNNLTVEFINCKVENTQLTMQYSRCIDLLYELRAMHVPDEPSQADDDAEPAVMTGNPGPGGMVADHDPGGMISDPDPGGMIADPDSGQRPLFAPTVDDLKQCAFNNESFRDSVVRCADRVELCAAEGQCWDTVDGQD